MQSIQILGVHDYTLTNHLKANVNQAMRELGLNIPVEEISSVDDFIQFNISGIPALVINGRVVSQQVVPTVSILKGLLQKLASNGKNLNPFAKILVPTDFSDNAEHALAYAIQIGNLFNSRISLLHTYQVQSSTGTFKSVENYLLEDARSDMQILLKRYQDNVWGTQDLNYKILRGSPVEQIVRTAKINSINLIIMGTQGASGLKEIFLGSNTVGVIQQTMLPILAIPNEYLYRPIKKIVLALDSKDIVDAQILDPLIELAKKMDAEVLVYHVITAKENGHIDASITDYLSKVKHTLHFENEKESVNASINAFVKEQNGDLLCMISRPRGFWDRVFQPSITQKEAFRSAVPLLVLQERFSD